MSKSNVAYLHKYTLPKLPAGVQCELTFITHAFLQDDGAVTSSSIRVRVDAADAESCIAEVKDRGYIFVPGEGDDAPASMYQWPFARIDIRLLR